MNFEYCLSDGIIFRQVESTKGTLLAKHYHYRKTPSISTYVFSGLAMVQVLIFGGRTYFRGV